MSTKLKVGKITNFVFDNLCDVLIFSVALLGSSFGKSRTSKGMDQAFEEAHEILEQYNHDTVRKAWKKLTNKGFIRQSGKKEVGGCFITNEGKRRLEETLPKYLDKRYWERKIYLITYDIPEKFKRKRDLLRETIKKLGGGLLLESVWVCPYNIRKEIDNLVLENDIPGMIIFSNTGKDGAVGDKPLKEMILEIYKLEEINRRYEEFIRIIKDKKISKTMTAILYLSILKDDPQLPFELLPDWFLGKEANEKYKEIEAKTD